MGVRDLLAGATLGISTLAVSVPAMAQVPSARHGFQPQFESKDKNTQRETPPPALPGAASDPATDTTKGAPIDLPPTEALFDSINRGDMVEARDALARGADLQAQNVLGMTPIALSVDLGRNDITFLLLSYRGSSSAPPPPTSTAADTAKPVKPARHPAAAVALTARPPAVRPRAPVVARAGNTNSARPDMTASSTPGVPVPQSGFLGFGGSAQN